MLSNRSKIFFITLLICLISPLILNAQNKPTVYSIAGVDVAGNQFTDKQTIIAITGFMIGEQLEFPGSGQNKLQSAIKNLWERKQFSDVQIVIDKKIGNEIFLLINVVENPRLNKIEVENNKELTQEEIVKKIGKNKGEVISNYDIYLAKHKLKDLYKDEGLYFTKVATNLVSTDTANYSNLIIDVDEGVEYHVSKIEFIGNKEFDNSKLAGTFDDTHAKSWWQFWRSSKFDMKEFETDKELLNTFFKKNGYVDAQILKDTLIYDDDKETVKIKIWVYEGKKIYLRNIHFDGNTVYSEKELIRQLDFKKGDAYNKDRFDKNLHQNEDNSDVTSLYADNGYLAARLKPQDDRVGDDSVDVTIKVYEYQRVRIRKVTIKGNTKTKDKVVRRELFTRPGDYFDRSAIIRSIRALGVMQYFNPEALKPDIKPVDDKTVDLVYQVEERSTDQFNASIGFMGTFGLTGSVGLTFNNFSLAEPLRGGGGQIMNLTAQFGQANRYQQYSIGFTEPWLFDEPTTVGFNLYYSWIRYTYLNIRRKGGVINLGRRFYWPDDYFRGDWSLRVQENYVEGDAGSYYRSGLSNEITIGQTISRTSFNSLFFPSVGSKFSFSTYFAMGALGLGNTDYLKDQLQFDMVSPLMKIDGNDRLVLFLSTNVGYIASFKSDTMISPIELFSMGGNGLSGFGVTPLRGYDDHTIGPISGGKSLIRHIIELRFAISLDPMPVYFYAFGEAGNVWANLKETNPFDLKRSAGIGIQLMIQPIGIIGFSYGYGFDPVRNNTQPGGWKFLFHLGQQF